MHQTDQIDTLLAATLRKGFPAWPAGWTAQGDYSAFLRRVIRQGISISLLPVPAGWPDAVLRGLSRQAKAQAHWELCHRVVLEKLLDELARRGVDSLFLKGTAVAYHAYEEPAERSRGDSDLLVRPTQIEQARGALIALNFKKSVLSRETGTNLQESWTLESGGYAHTVDLHWAAFNSPFLAKIFTVDECFAHSVPLSRLAPNAYRLTAPYLLLHICIHRATHRTAPFIYPDSVELIPDRLIWAIDIKKLCHIFSDADWMEFRSLALSKGVSRAIAEALEFSTRLAGAKIPEAVRLGLQGTSRREIRSDYLLTSGRRSRIIRNVLAVDGWLGRLRFVRAQFAPSTHSLRERYPNWPRTPRTLLLILRTLEFALGRGKK